MLNFLKETNKCWCPHLFGKCLLIVACGVSSGTFAQRRSRFERVPSARKQAVQEAFSRATTRKTEARVWARARGLKMRRRVNGRVIELMEIRNGRPYYYSTHNDVAAISTATDLVRDAAPYQLDGSGLTIGVWDGDEVYANHQEFAGGRVTIFDSTPNPHWHATHVAGTIGAAGVQTRAKGMAPAVLLDSYDWQGDTSEMTLRAASFPGETNKIYLSNHSYGFIVGWDKEGTDYYWYGSAWNSAAVDNGFGRYGSSARQTDEIVYNAPYYLPFKAAGNDRNDNPSVGDTVHFGETGAAETYSTSSHPAGDGNYKQGFDTISLVGNAKNIITVGAVTDAAAGGVRSLVGVDTTVFSSWGPADDGRIKPDIVANGSTLYSCDNANPSAYRTVSGTSMSSPNACGSAALLVQHYANLVSNGVMRASTLKGLIIHTADDLGRPGPDYQFGWGLMNTQAAADLLADDAGANPLRMTEGMLGTTNASDTYTFFSGGIQPIRVTLCWTDPPGTATGNHDNRSARLVNDLDLKITGPGGTNYPYKLDFNNPAANATATGENNIDNVEQVYIEVPVAGQYTITVDYDGLLSGVEQWYSLLVDGSSIDSDSDMLPDYWEIQYFGSATGAVATTDSDGDGSDNLAEYVSGHNPTNAQSVFAIIDFSIPATGDAPHILTWDSVEGRVYNLFWSDNLTFNPFANHNISGDLPYPVGSYTDAVPRTAPQNFYRIDVRLDQ